MDGVGRSTVCIYISIHVYVYKMGATIPYIYKCIYVYRYIYIWICCIGIEDECHQTLADICVMQCRTMQGEEMHKDCRTSKSATA